MSIRDYIIVLLFYSSAFGQTSISTSKPSADELISDVIKNEKWIESAKSFYVRLESTYPPNDKINNLRIEKLTKKNPGKIIDTSNFPQLNAPAANFYIAAFDEHRFIHSSGNKEGLFDSSQSWDGSRQLTHIKYADIGSESYSVAPYYTPCETLLSDGAWPRPSINDFWWNPLSLSEFELKSRGLKRILNKEAIVAGPVVYRGIACWLVIFKQQDFERWYVGIDDHLLYGRCYGVSNRDAPEMLEAHLAAARMEGANLHSIDEYQKWTKTHKIQDQISLERYFGEINIQAGINLTSTNEIVTTNYKQIASGCWYPMEQHFIEPDASTNLVQTTTQPAQQKIKDRQLNVSEISINKPIPDDLFKMKFTDGAEIYDSTYWPPIKYTFSEALTPVQFQEIIDEAKVKSAAIYKPRQKNPNVDRILGKNAYDFPTRRFLNGKPVKLTDFKGKIVLLNFYSDWIPPCSEEVSELSKFDHSKDPAVIQVIGIQPYESPEERVLKFLKDRDVKYPVYLDIENSLSAGYSMKSNYGRPFNCTIVIGSDGKIAGYGNVGAAIEIAKNLSERIAAAQSIKKD